MKTPTRSGHRSSALADALGSCRMGLRGAFVFSLIMNVLLLTGPFYMLQIYDRVLTSQSLPTLAALSILVLALLTLYGCFEFLRTRLMARVAAMLDLKAAGEPLPAAAVCLSPWFDLAGTGESIRTRASLDPSIRSSDLAFVARCYLGPVDPETPTASPLYGDLAGLPPILIQVGTDEILLDDSRRFAQKATEAGVPVQLEIWDDMFHVWHAYARFIPEARSAIEKIGEFLRSTWGRAG